MAEIDMHLETYRFMVSENSILLKTYSVNNTYCLFRWHIRKFPLVRTFYSMESDDLNDFRCYSILKIYPDKVVVEIEGTDVWSQWDITISTHSGEVLLRKYSSLVSRYSSNSCHACVEGEDFQKLKNLPDNSCIVTYRIIRLARDTRRLRRFIYANRAPEYLKLFEDDGKSYSESSENSEMVNLCVGEETEIVNKAVLCSRSPVFANMFRNDMRESKENTVIITDIKMSVLRAFVSFLYSESLMDYDYDFLCDLYYAADKFNVPRLRVVCSRLLLTKVTLKNIFQLLKLSLLHSDEILKSAAMTLISANIKTVELTSDWEDLMANEPEIALKASTFFDL